jgi:hypothetical protein
MALHEEKTMEDLCAEIAALVGLKGKEYRQLYNWRTGKWPLPSNVIPALCRRFKSRALLHALEAECNDVVVEVPQDADITRLVSRSMRQDLGLCEQFLDAYESDGIQPRELRELRETAERTIASIYLLVEVASADCEKRHPSDHPSDHSKRSSGNPSDQTLNRAGRSA